MNGDPLTAAEAYLEQLRQDALVAEAEELVAGVRHLSVVTGELETTDDANRLEQLSSAAWRGRDGGRVSRSRGGNDYVTFFIEGPAAEQLVAELTVLANTLNPGWWRIGHSPNLV